MNVDWPSIIFDAPSAGQAWTNIFAEMQAISQHIDSATSLHVATVAPDRLLSEAAWELWQQYPLEAIKTSAEIKKWCRMPSASGRAVLIIDALSLRELPALVQGANKYGVRNLKITVTGAECPSTTDQFAKAIGAASRGVLANNKKPANFDLFGAACYTDVVDLPFEDCGVPPTANILLWHTWLDDLIHLNQTPNTLTAVQDHLRPSGSF